MEEDRGRHVPRSWYGSRGAEFVVRRAFALVSRYGLTAGRATERILSNMAGLAENGCAPTYATPGRVVERHPRLFQQLQGAGAEIAVHGYDHIDLGIRPLAEAMKQLEQAIDVFQRHGIEVHGFRCPYLGWSHELLCNLPEGYFGYSSNRAVGWNTGVRLELGDARAVFRTIEGLYTPLDAREVVSAPFRDGPLIEIPVCVPDDLQLHDGLRLDGQAIARTWIDMLEQTHARGELLTLLFHPELADACTGPIVEVLARARTLRPNVWIARLRDINDWWREKEGFSAHIERVGNGERITFDCSERATILVRRVATSASTRPWDREYRELEGKWLSVSGQGLPLVGIARDVPGTTASFLREQGYILETTNAARRCGIYVDAALLTSHPSQVDLVNYIEGSEGPLVRYWRWPNNNKSALAVTGDLDALSLLDYSSRIFA